ncbi:hypothetical protein D3C73_676080 [compost metagenome]
MYIDLEQTPYLKNYSLFLHYLELSPIISDLFKSILSTKDEFNRIQLTDTKLSNGRMFLNAGLDIKYHYRLLTLYF